MTTLSEAREAIYLTFVNGWESTSEYTFDNEDYTPPASAPWVRLSVRHNASTQETLGRTGNRRFERSGSVIIQVFTVQDEGTAGSDTLAAAARGIFEGTSIAGTTIRFNDVIVSEVGPTGKWYQVNVEATFNYDETK